MAVSKLDEVVSLAKRRGFVFPAGEIYGGTRSAWDYGPLGVALKDNIKREWWRSMVVTRGDVVGVDTSIILPTPVWVASGHVAVFNDPLVECLNCHKRQRSDKLEDRTPRSMATSCRRTVWPTSCARIAEPAASGPNRATST